MKFCSVDADNAGSKVGRAVMSNDPDKVRSIAHIIESGETLIDKWTKEQGGEMISFGGDEARFILPDEAIKNIEELRSQYFKLTGFTLSVGIGSSMTEGEKALIAAKLTGKDKTVTYYKEIEDLITGQGEERTPEEEKKKQLDAYFKTELMSKSALDSRAINEDTDSLSDLSLKLELGNRIIKDWTLLHGGQFIGSDGNTTIIKVRSAQIYQLEELSQAYRNVVGTTVTIGVGKKLSECTKARMLGKLTGKNKTVVFDESTIKELEMRMAQDEGSKETKKMNITMEPQVPGEPIGE